MLHLSSRLVAPSSATLIVLFLLQVTTRSAFADPPVTDLAQRSPWTTSRITGSPEPPLPYITERVYPRLTFNKCLDIVAAPGSDRLFVVEQSGKILSFVDRPEVTAADLVIDMAAAIPDVNQVYALAFHPDFANNRFCYVCYIKAANLDDGTHVARFAMSDSDPPTIAADSETTLLTWRSGGHNGCSLKFGPDGCLYISTGDAAPANPPDTFQTGQDISDLLSSILRIDVDHAEDGNNYRIPADNPFVSVPGARGEVWAYGLRNPWRMSFDQQTGDLWVGDVGWELWELLYRIERGGNYGWAVREGRHSTHPEWPRGPTPILPPTIDHSHTESSSITDGLTYYGSRLKDLHGMHIYGDYDTGKFWGFRFRDGEVVDHRELADSTHRVVGFGTTRDGEMLILDHVAGTINRLKPNPQSQSPSDFPRKLSESGLFASINPPTPAAGVLPYSINAEPWADHALTERWVAVPGAESIQPAESMWSFPKDSVLVKTLSLDLTANDPASRRRIETQILHFDGLDWQPYTYQWNEAQSDAVLVGATGAERTLQIKDQAATPGVREQTWRFAGRAECQRCHNKWSGPALAFNTPQLNREHRYGDVTASQLDRLAGIGLLAKPVPVENRPRLVDPQDTTADLNDRARAYLHANCAACHRLHAGGSVLSHMHFDLDLAKTNMLGTRPTQGTFGIHAAQVVAPGDPFRSILLYRMAKVGSGRMPYIGSAEVDQQGLKLIHSWLDQLPPQDNQETAAKDTIANRRAAEAAAVKQLQSATDAARRIRAIDQLLTSTSGALRLLRALDDGLFTTPLASQVVTRATRHDQASVRDLFERFLPPHDRIKRLGSVVRTADILGLPSDVKRGQRVFFQTEGVACKNCHRIDQQGKEVGPELSKIGQQLSPAQLLESILEPSKRIDPKFVTYLAETDDGRLLTGLLLREDDEEVVLKDARDRVNRIPKQSIERLVPQRQSLMPELLLRDMTAQQVADLLAYLSSLK